MQKNAKEIQKELAKQDENYERLKKQYIQSVEETRKITYQMAETAFKIQYLQSLIKTKMHEKESV